jgi:hypothetical protein
METLSEASPSSQNKEGTLGCAILTGAFEMGDPFDSFRFIEANVYALLRSIRKRWSVIPIKPVRGGGGIDLDGREDSFRNQHFVAWFSGISSSSMVSLSFPTITITSSFVAWTKSFHSLSSGSVNISYK